MNNVKDIIDEAVGAAWAVFYEKLTSAGVKFDDCDGGAYIDDETEKKTYCVSISTIECDEYGGEM